MKSPQNKIPVGIVGGSGYTGGELIRILNSHPSAEISFVTSRSKAGQELSSVHTDLLGTTDLKFISEALPEHLSKIDVLFSALPAGESKLFIDQNTLSPQLRIIDLSSDFRHHQDWIYGLPEIHAQEIKSATRVANPGCFATAIQLSVLPLALARTLDQISVTGITGSTGAGQNLSETSHFSFRDNNIQAYKTLNHQHTPEVETELRKIQGDSKPKLNFIPWRGNFTRGIFVSTLIESTLTQAQALSKFYEYYVSNPFVTVTASPINLKSVVNTNRAHIEVQGNGTHLAIHVAIDNLLKGASGQAVHNFNLMMGMHPTTGLQLKGSAF